jgi:hypothetical protein
LRADGGINAIEVAANLAPKVQLSKEELKVAFEAAE